MTNIPVLSRNCLQLLKRRYNFRLSMQNKSQNDTRANNRNKEPREVADSHDDENKKKARRRWKKGLLASVQVTQRGLVGQNRGSSLGRYWNF